MDSILETPGFEAVLFITHDLDLALIYATRVLLMANGELVADGPPEQVLRDRDRLRNYRMIPTSLLEANLARLGPTERFMRAERLAHLAA
jgi:energy-coupling factor transport system ATP-binding protein